MYTCIHTSYKYQYQHKYCRGTIPATYWEVKLLCEFTYVAMLRRKTSISQRICRLKYAGRSWLVGDIDNGGKLFSAVLQVQKHSHKNQFVCASWSRVPEPSILCAFSELTLLIRCWSVLFTLHYIVKRFMYFLFLDKEQVSNVFYSSMFLSQFIYMHAE